MVGLLLWLPFFLSPRPVAREIPTAFFFGLLHGIAVKSVFFSTAGAFALVLFQAILLNYLLAQNNLLPKNSMLAAFVYVLIASTLPWDHTLHPALIIVFFPIVVIGYFNKLYEETEPLKVLFGSGVYLGISVLFYNQFFVFALFIYAALLVMRVASWRSFFVPVTGFITPFLFVATYYFWKEETLSFFRELFLETFNFQLQSFKFHVISLIIVIIIALIVMQAITANFISRHKKNIDIRKKLFLLTILLVLCFLFLCLNNSLYNSAIILLVPSAAIISIFLNTITHVWLYNLLIWVIIILGSYYNFALFFNEGLI